MFRPSLLVPLLLLLGCTESERNPAEVVVARVDGEAIHAARLAAALAEGGLGQAPATVRRETLEHLIDRHLLVREATKRGLRLEEETVERAFARLRADYPGESFDGFLVEEEIDAATLRESLRESLLVQRLLFDEVVARVALGDEEIEAWLEEHAEELSRPEQVRAAQIVVKTEEEAQAIREQLAEGASFEELARTHSLSPDGKKGGDLGFFAKGEMPPPFDEVCFELAPGEVSAVVSSSYGFHVFKLLERRGAAELAPEELRAEAERRLRRQKKAAAQQAFVARLRQAAQIEVDEAALSRQ